MKYDVHGTVEVVITITIDAESGEEAIEKANEVFGGVYSYAGNGGLDKLIGVNGSNESINVDSPVEFDDWTEH